MLSEFMHPECDTNRVGHAKVHEHRAAGLERGDLIPTSVWSVAV